MKTVLITGGSGFIGSHVAEAFHISGWSVVVLDDLSSGRTENLVSLNGKANFEFVVGSVTDQEIVQRLTMNAEVIIHLAALVSVPISIAKPCESFSRNVLGTFNVFEAARTARARPAVIYASSAAVYGLNEKAPVSEADPIAPLSPYACDKAYAELVAAAYFHSFHVPSTGFRFFNVYGPRQDPRSPYSGVISKFAELMMTGKPCTIFGDGQQTRDFVYVGDVVAAIQRAATHMTGDSPMPLAGPEIFNLGTGQPVTISNLHAVMARQAGHSLPPVHESTRDGEVRNSCASIAAARERLGWMPAVSLEQGLRDCWLPQKSP